MLPPDSHVHSEWSWDAPAGSMELTCARAVAIGLPAIAFTEHADYTALTVTSSSPDSDDIQTGLDAEGVLIPPALNVAGYLEGIQRCRDKFPDLHILTGVELGEPHWHAAVASKLLRAGPFDRVLGSLHCLPSGPQFTDVADCYQHEAAHDVVRDYLAEIPGLIDGFEGFSVLAHVHYPLRYWPAEAGHVELSAFEDEFRYALGALAHSGRALEINTEGPLGLEIVRWWREEGGTAVTFGSDAHEPDVLANRFREAAAIAEACGFRAGRGPYDFWASA